MTTISCTPPPVGEGYSRRVTSPSSPVIFVHGWAGSFQRTWEEPGIAELVRDTGRRVAGCDLPGHGTAGVTNAPTSDREIRDSLYRAIDDLGSPPVTAVGFSLGALTVLGAVIEQPELFDRVVLAGIGDRVMQPHDTRQTERIIAAVRGTGDATDISARVFGRLAREGGNDPESLIAVLERQRRDPFSTHELARLAVPVLVAIGDADFEFPASQLAAAIPAASLAVLPRVDHFRTPESVAFIDALLDFLCAQ